MLDINKLTLGEIKEIAALIGNNTPKEESHFQVGKQYFIRTVTMHLVGKLISVNHKELLLQDASWVADSGRFHIALKNGELSEVEPFSNDVIVGRDAIIDATVWEHVLPQRAK